MSDSPALRLYIGNKNYSSWSMRAGVLVTQFGIAVEEVMVPLDDMAPEGAFKQAIRRVSPAGRVPVLEWADGSLRVWDSLAIAEALADQFPQLGLWPGDRIARAEARRACCEMHSGFTGLRSACPMNIEADLSAVGARLMTTDAALRADLARIVQLWSDALRRWGGPFLFGGFSVADAYFAPVVARIRSYGLPVPEPIAGYLEHVWNTAGVQAWVSAALAEHHFVAADEPYRSAP